jgi:uncharacterized protein (TIGR02001 family)
MKLIRGGAFLVGLLGVASATQAGVTSTWTAVSDYDFRGITQTGQDPALQASLDYAHDSGWYIGAWASNIDFGVDEAATGIDDPNIEVDFYTGFTKTLDSGFNYDVGGVFYDYPQEDTFNYFELYAGVGFAVESGLSVKGKLFYSPDFGGDATDGDTPAQYLSGDLTMPLPAKFSITAHVGYSFGDYWDGDFYPPGTEYFDYSVGVGYTAGKFNLALKYIDGSDLPDCDDAPPGTCANNDLFSTDSKVVVSASTTFPWAE